MSRELTYILYKGSVFLYPNGMIIWVKRLKYSLWQPAGLRFILATRLNYIYLN